MLQYLTKEYVYKIYCKYTDRHHNVYIYIHINKVESFYKIGIKKDIFEIHMHIWKCLEGVKQMRKWCIYITISTQK